MAKEALFSIFSLLSDHALTIFTHNSAFTEVTLKAAGLLARCSCPEFTLGDYSVPLCME